MDSAFFIKIAELGLLLNREKGMEDLKIAEKKVKKLNTESPEYAVGYALFAKVCFIIDPEKALAYLKTVSIL